MTSNTAEPRLVCLSYGAGQDSAAILTLLITDPAFRKRWAPHDLFVVFSDTGSEHPETYEHLGLAKRAAEGAGIRFEILSLERGYHRGKWALGLEGFYRATKTVGSKAFKKSCSDNLKVQPVYRRLEEVVAEEYGMPKSGRKIALKTFAKTYGRIRVLIGFGKGEEKRCVTPPQPSLLPLPSTEDAWMTLAIERAYPLIVEGYDRAAAQEIIRRGGLFPTPIPSNCALCPYKDEREVLLTSLLYPDIYARWVEIEQTKLATWEGRTPRNLGVWAREGVRLPDIVAEAKRMYPTWTVEQLVEHRMSHGHNTKSKH